MKYAKLLDEGIILAKKTFIDNDGKTIFNFTSNPELLKEYGFKPVVEQIKPDYPYRVFYEENEDNILETIVGDFDEYKKIKYTLNDKKADEKRYNQEFTITVQDKICVFDTSAKTQTDLLTAFCVCSTGSTYDGWITNNGIELDLTLEDVNEIASTFKELSNVYPKWNQLKEQIDNATTIEELKNIVIDYDM